MLLALNGTPLLTSPHAKVTETPRAGCYLKITKTITYSQPKKHAVVDLDIIASVNYNYVCNYLIWFYRDVPSLEMSLE